MVSSARSSSSSFGASSGIQHNEHSTREAVSHFSSQNDNRPSNSSGQQPSVATTALRDATMTSLLCVLPYILCKGCIACQTAFIEYFYGQYKGNSSSSDPTLASEADALTWEFLWMGTAMGGLRAVGILTAAACTSYLARDDDDGAAYTKMSLAFIVRYMLRGRLSQTRDGKKKASMPTTDEPEKEQLADVANMAWLLTTVYGIIISFVFYYSATTFFVSRHKTNPAILQRVQDYGQGFSFGVLPILWLYLNGQFTLGLESAGVPFLYDGVVNCVVSIVCAWYWYPTHGAYGMGLGMTVGAWVAFVLNTLHFAVFDAECWSLTGITPLPSLYVFKPPANTEISQEFPTTSGQRLSRLFSLPIRRTDLFKQFLSFAVPLSIANMLGLAQNLLTTAFISQKTDADALALSISGAYYQTMNIAMLAASSVLSAVVSSNVPLSKVSRASPPSSNEEGEGEDGSVVREGAADDGRDEGTALLLVSEEHDAALTRIAETSGRARFTYAAVVSAFLIILSTILGLLPILAPKQFAMLFGGSVYSFGPQLTEMLLTRVKFFNVVNFISFVIATFGLCIGACLHAWGCLWPPTLLCAGGNVASLVWSFLFEDSSTRLLAWGNVLGAGLQAVLLSGLLWWKRRDLFF